jgi:AcrR family transcriptional regulator
MISQPSASETLQARDKILTTAARLFAEQGYESTSLAQVARQAKVSKALIFWHFESKDALYRNALHKTLEPYSIDLQTLAGLNEREQIERAIDQFYEFTCEHVYSVRFFLSLMARTGPESDESLHRVVELHRHFEDVLADIIESGQRAGMFRHGIEARREAAQIMATLAGILLQRFVDGDRPDAVKDLLSYSKITIFQRLSA